MTKQSLISLPHELAAWTNEQRQTVTRMGAEVLGWSLYFWNTCSKGGGDIWIKTPQVTWPIASCTTGFGKEDFNPLTSHDDCQMVVEKVNPLSFVEELELMGEPWTHLTPPHLKLIAAIAAQMEE